jgi:putative hydrolase of the HAD superfamily
MTTPRAVLFDFGGVLYRQDWEEYDQFAANHGLPPRTLRDALYRTPEWHGLQTGTGDRETWEAAAIREMAQHAGERARAILEEWWAKPPRVHEPNVELARALKRAGHRIGLLSNAGPDLRERITDFFSVEIDWDHMVISGLVGVAKPDPAIYRLAAEGVGLPPERCFFIDDAPRNVEAAREVGMGGYHFVGRDYEGLQAALRAAGYEW